MNQNPDRGFVPERVASTIQTSGFVPAVGRTLAGEYGTCPECNESLQGAVRGGREVDRDIEFNEVSCPGCDADLRVLVEEKIWGFAGNLDDPGVVGDVFDYEDGYFFVNPSLVYVSTR